MTALAAFARTRDSAEFADLHMPEVPPPESLARMGFERVTSLRAQLDSRPAFGEPMRASAPRALAGGWLRLAEPRVLDAPLLAMLCDAWPPAVAQHRALAQKPPGGMPTVDLTVHFRAPIPADAKPDDFYLAVFRSHTLRDGFAEEDGGLTRAYLSRTRRWRCWCRDESAATPWCWSATARSPLTRSASATTHR